MAIHAHEEQGQQLLISERVFDARGCAHGTGAKVTNEEAAAIPTLVASVLYKKYYICTY